MVFTILTLSDTDGNFQPLNAFLFYYIAFLVMLVFNIVFNSDSPECPLKYLIGVLINSFSTVLSYNCHDYSRLLGSEQHEKEKRVLHQQSFLRQSVYTLFITLVYISVTAIALQWMAQDGTTFYLTDTVGFRHNVEAEFFSTIIGVSWGCHIGACLLSIGYYNSHPSSVTMDPQKKTDLWILGRKWDCLSLLGCKTKDTKVTDQGDPELFPLNDLEASKATNGHA